MILIGISYNLDFFLSQDVPVDILERGVSVPESFMCKINHDIMREPTMVRKAFADRNVEMLVGMRQRTHVRESSDSHLARQQQRQALDLEDIKLKLITGEDPMTKKPFKMEDLAPNLVRSLICCYFSLINVLVSTGSPRHDRGMDRRAQIGQICSCSR